ncbi:MAG TPA: alpha/beta hydrolase [Spirochaetota bacterium]|nr:alpha/beta hydrolase [Spirochaetota bacterium]HPC42490.1 alpha/beta hydrolase [Spirochaetota bacterium]HPL15055.1 alpha/beta hydrolase [Spirochaetota bacterium]HQF08062.1 alpha/beta hydrolase [Spirochaetota bacterium]HQH97051.1 alpha/beta hydrolase [Spirochaetota bacterium]
MLANRLYVMALVFLAAISLNECSCKNRYLFHPYKQILTTPGSIGLAYEDVYFAADDGIRLNGWWVPASPAAGTVLFCHGNAGNISFLMDTLRLYHDLKLNVLVFDYRGFGRSVGKPREEGTYRDAAAAWEYLVQLKKIDPATIAVIGRSLGGPIAAWLCQTRMPGALVLESTFTRAADVARYHYQLAPADLIFGDTYNTVGFLSRIDCPVLVVHSPDDEIIPYELGEKLFKSVKGQKEFLQIHGSHNSGFMESRSLYVPGLKRFLVGHLKRS